MSTYKAPLEDMAFVIDELLEAEQVLGSLPAFADYGVGSELTTALLDEAAKLAGEVLAPLRRVGDEQGATCVDGVVTITPGFSDAIGQLAEGGWIGISANPDFGGQGLPELYGTAANEMWQGSNMAFALHAMLGFGAAMAIEAHASEELKATFLTRMNSGEWAGTMNLTEAGAGSDLGVMKSRAVPEGDHYRVYGQKIFITWGDHEANDNIVHLVLARLPDAPKGSGGISLFVVPKFLVNTDGSLGERNDVYAVSVEHKLGIHGSPTCVMSFGDNDGAIGYLVGEENRGLQCMFTMMNEARLKVGLQGLGSAEGAYQKALVFAHERVQGGVPIVQHADVKRMLLVMNSLIEAMRAFAYTEALTMDLIHNGPESQRQLAQRRLDLMIPVIKAWHTEVGQELTSLGVQVHGGMGYVEETGAAQYLRDVRITSIYEGTNGIQAADLVSRKLGRDGGATMALALADVDATVSELRSVDQPSLQAIAQQLSDALLGLRESTDRILEYLKEDPEVAMGAAFDYLMQTGYVFGGWHMARSALCAQKQIDNGSDREFYPRKIATALFYVNSILPRARGHAGILQQAEGLKQYPVDWL